MSNNDLIIWEVHLKRLQNELIEAKLQKNQDYVRHLKTEISKWNKQKPRLINNESVFTVSPFYTLWVLKLKLIWKFTIRFFTYKY